MEAVRNGNGGNDEDEWMEINISAQVKTSGNRRYLFWENNFSSIRDQFLLYSSCSRPASASHHHFVIKIKIIQFFLRENNNRKNMFNFFILRAPCRIRVLFMIFLSRFLMFLMIPIYFQLAVGEIAEETSFIFSICR